jgi:imidazolonepropionase
MRTLFKNIKQLIQVRDIAPAMLRGAEMAELPVIDNAFLIIEDGLIVDYGEMVDCPKLYDAEIIDASGKLILPSWCDSHTHIVYAGNREGEFVDRINGLSYEEIAANGGGILNSAKKLQNSSVDELYTQSAARLREVMKQGTGAIEIKSGYGLTREAELKMLRVIKKLKENFNIPIKATFLAAHALPLEYKGKKTAFIERMLSLIPIIKEEGLADYIDVFCEKGYFDVADTEKVMKAGLEHGLKPKIHVNQFTAIGGVKAGVDNGALSVDHLEVMNPEDFEALKDSATMPVALPSCSYFLSIPYTPAREMLTAGLPLALASDYNPGSTPSGNMNFVLSTACIKMKMTPEEAINAMTINAAYAMDLSSELGSITRGKKANLIMTKEISSYAFMPYAFGSDCIDGVWVSGVKVE